IQLSFLWFFEAVFIMMYVLSIIHINYGDALFFTQVIRMFGALSNVTVYWEAEAASEGELIYRSGNLTFGVGQTIGTIYLLISQDDVPELDKSFKILLSNVSHGRLGNLTIATLTVLASDDPYGLFEFSESSRPFRVVEADTLVTLTIWRQKGLMGRVRVPYTNITIRIMDDKDPERAESAYVELSSVTLLQGAQTRPGEIIIEASDNAFGVLQLSSSAVSVPEFYVGPIINVTRTGGIFADVSVKFRAVPMTDYSVASSDVVLLEGESSKPVPILIINDMVPELEETFRIELLNQTTGGAFLGELTRAIITILPSDDPYGSFVYRVQEPLEGVYTANITVQRRLAIISHLYLRCRIHNTKYFYLLFLFFFPEEVILDF
uniref:Calx-beta domain-containing protein n=1 Tax=Electrophorus electricus TaxID=8005 RepID=A0AAY5ERU0_ELEEL